jgi:3-hydroxyisobutyrate dehydrogenase-like beta-hydroxyacid dehydrogenase
VCVNFLPAQSRKVKNVTDRNDMIGFIGLGRLGLPLATNLLQAGYPLRVYNRTASKAEPLLAQGARLAVHPADAATPGGVVITLVWDDAAIERLQVLFPGSAGSG